MITPAKLDNLLGRVKFNDWYFRHGPIGDGFYLQTVFPARDPDKPGAWFTQYGRKWYISKHATESETVNTAFLAILTALEHEAREQFTYMGLPIFHPHHSLMALCDVANVTDTREAVPA